MKTKVCSSHIHILRHTRHHCIGTDVSNLSVLRILFSTIRDPNVVLRSVKNILGNRAFQEKIPFPLI